MQLINCAEVAELADAHDSKSCGKPCGFDSRLRHQNFVNYSGFSVLKKVTLKPFFAFNRVCLVRHTRFPTAHSCRHTFGHELVVRKTPLDVVARLMGHVKNNGLPNIEMTLVYTQPGEDDLQRAVKELSWS